MNFYKRYPGDYMRDTALLSLTEHGAYTMLLDHLYSTEKPIRNPLGFYRVCRSVTENEKKAVDTIRDEYFTETKEGWVNMRVLEEIEKTSKQRKAAQDNGSRGGRPVKKNPKQNLNKTKTKPSGFLNDNPGGNLNITQHESSPDTRLPDYRFRNKTNNRFISKGKCQNFSEQDFETAKWMFAKILELNPDNKKPNLNTWADTIRLMRVRDNRTDVKIREIFILANNDEFWCKNILSPKKLREKFDELIIKMDGKNVNITKKHERIKQTVDSENAFI